MISFTNALARLGIYSGTNYFHFRPHSYYPGKRQTGALIKRNYRYNTNYFCYHAIYSRAIFQLHNCPCYISDLVDPCSSKISANKEKMIKLVAFDWNGTLIADGQLVADCCNVELKDGYKVNKTIDLKIYREVFDIPVNQFFIDLGLDPKLVEEKTTEAADVFHKAYEKGIKKCRTRKNVRSTLHWLQENDIQSVIVSNHAKEKIEEQLKRLKIHNLINHVCGNDHIYVSYTIKGKEKRLIDYLDKHNIKPQEVLLIGDAVEDVVIGNDMGTQTAALTNGHCTTARLKAEKPDYLISNLSEIKNIILKLN